MECTQCTQLAAAHQGQNCKKQALVELSASTYRMLTARGGGCGGGDGCVVQVPSLAGGASGALVPVRLPLMSLASHAFQLPWWAQLGALVAANVLGLQVSGRAVRVCGTRGRGVGEPWWVQLGPCWQAACWDCR